MSFPVAAFAAVRVANNIGVRIDELLSVNSPSPVS